MDIQKLKKVVDEAKELYAEDATDLCEEASNFLCVILTENGFIPTFVIGDFKRHKNGKRHSWVLVENVAIDITVHQFGKYESGLISKDFYEKYYVVKETYPGELRTLDEEDVEYYNVIEFRKRFKGEEKHAL